MADAELRIDAAALLDQVQISLSERVLIRRSDLEHVALSMADCFSDAEGHVLNRLRAALGYGPVKKVGQGACRGWVPDTKGTA
ncbi:hypothetical protein [Nocardia abscessus]|uniref:hypothetical protein n=1 Tax=Nocardia abscessus TaxID=120957 RepID=UPI0024567C9A|nr:hypothetical protein [Nocardia abscessus]